MRLSIRFAEEFLRVLGFDWLLLFLQPQVKSSSVILAANCLLLLLSCPQYLARFREGVSTGTGWTRSRDLIVTQAYPANAAGPLRLVGRTFSVASEEMMTPNLQSQQQQQPGQLPGFQLLGWLLVNHTSLPEIFYLLIGLMVGKAQLKTSSQVKKTFQLICEDFLNNPIHWFPAGLGDDLELFVRSESWPADCFAGWPRCAHVLSGSYNHPVCNDAGHHESRSGHEKLDRRVVRQLPQCFAPVPLLRL